MCGTQNLSTGRLEEEVGIRVVPCPTDTSMSVSDLVVKFDVFECDLCYNCGYYKKIKRLGSKWNAHCANGAAITKVWPVIVGAKPSQGYDPHQCLPTF